MTSTPDTIRVFIPLTIRRRNGRPRILPPADMETVEPRSRTCYGPLPAPGVGDVRSRSERLRPSVTLPSPKKSRSGLSAARCAWPISHRLFWRSSSPTAGHARSRSRISSPQPSVRGVSKRLWCSRADRHRALQEATTRSPRRRMQEGAPALNPTSYLPATAL